MKPTLLVLAVCLVLFSCNKGASGNGLLWECDNSQHLDSSAIAAKLTGTWKWEQQRRGSNLEVMMADKIVTVTFNADSTFKVLEDSLVTAQGNWKLVMFSNDMWALDLSAPSNYLYGAISFCNNKVLFTDSYVDGNDNLFEKVN
jgi:hypothetical protein